MLIVPASAKPGKAKTELSIPEKASIAMELCDAYLQNNQPEDAAATMAQAMQEFKVNKIIV